MKFTWLTDIHLNFLEQEARLLFYQDILKTNCDAILISGDIAEAPSIAEILQEMCTHTNKPIYFVLGNHDYYRGQIDQVREEMTFLTKSQPLLHWLPASGPQFLEKNIVLAGQDGWADGRFGDYYNSRASLNDSKMIIDLFQQKILSKNHLLEKMQQLADADAKQLENNLKQALSKNPKKIIVLTHIPPFKEACWHKNRMSNDDYLPFFSSRATGDVLINIAQETPTIDFLVLCGHTHSAHTYQPLNNLVIQAGKAEYFQPKPQSIIEYS